MSASEEPLVTQDPISEVPKRGKKRYVLLAFVVVVAIVFGLRRARSKPVASDAAPPEAES
jgi:hypothetical protein